MDALENAAGASASAIFDALNALSVADSLDAADAADAVGVAASGERRVPSAEYRAKKQKEM